MHFAYQFITLRHDEISDCSAAPTAWLGSLDLPSTP
jgi:hypothetical protein